MIFLCTCPLRNGSVTYSGGDCFCDLIAQIVSDATVSQEKNNMAEVMQRILPNIPLENGSQMFKWDK